MNRREVLFLVAVTAFVVALRLPTLDQPLVEAHGFRQTQTAWSARIYHEQGIDLLRPEVPVLGEPFEVPFEFPLFQAIASLPIDLGVSEEMALRGTSLVFFLLTALLLYGLLRYVSTFAIALTAVLVFALSPFAFVWSRTSMIEYLATAATVGAVWAGIVWREQRQIWLLVLACALGALAMAVKLTTGLLWVLPVLAYRTRGQRTRSFGTLVLIAVPLIAGFLWTNHADEVKAATETTAWLTSSALSTWNLGTLEQRLDSFTWTFTLSRADLFLIGRLGLVPLLLSPFVAYRSDQHWFWLALLALCALPILLFTNLYLIHDYYLAAIAPWVAAVVALPIGSFFSRPRSNGALILVAMAILVWAGVTLNVTRWYWKPTYDAVSDPQAYLPTAAEIDQVTDEGELVVASGLDWTPAPFFYADARGLMLAPQMVDSVGREALAVQVFRDDYDVLFSADPREDLTWLTSKWNWIGAAGPRAYYLGMDRAEMDDAPVMATSESVSRPRTQPLDVACDGTALDIAATGIVGFLFRGDTSVQISFLPGFAPLPARPTYLLADDLDVAGLEISCSGADEIRLVPLAG